MSKSKVDSSTINQSHDSETGESEFVLKHRLAGAAFLLFFGALVLPLVLGAPGNKANINLLEGRDDSELPTESQAAIEEMAAQIIGASDDNDDDIYISKITPLDAQRIEAERKAKQADIEASKSKEAEKIQPLENTQSNSVANIEPDKSSSKPDEDVKSRSENKQAIKAEPKDADAPEPLISTQPKIAENKEKKELKLGWVVQVGVFTDKRGAGKVIEDLQSKGFDPSTTIVDTNRGPASGTRIWLGPFEQRVDAAKAKATLTEKTGEAGFIRAYP